MKTPTNKLGQQRVLVVPAESVSPLFQKPCFYYDQESKRLVTDSISSNGKFVDREWAENNSSVKQIIAYAMVRYGESVLCLRRSRKSNRESLRLRYTLFFGGHVEDEKNSTQPIIDCLNRELQEELGISSNGTTTLLGIAAEPTTNVGLLHLGLIFEVISSRKEITIGPNLDNVEFVNSNKIKTHHMVGWDTLVNIADKLDPWSTLFLNSDIAHQILNARTPLMGQMQLPLLW